MEAVISALFRTTTKALTTWRGVFHCPKCASVQECERKTVREYATLLGAPIFPRGTVGEFVECEKCKGTFESDAATYDALSADTERRVFDEVRDVVVHELLRDPSWRDKFAEFARVLEAHGHAFYSPGGSVQRLVIYLVTNCLTGNAEHPYLAHADVRVALKPFLIELRRRRRSSVQADEET